MRLFFTLSLLSFWLLLDVEAQTEIDLSAFEYRCVGPTRGGRVTAVAGDAGRPNVFYIGATGGGVWKTEDYGTSWENISDGFFATPSIGAIRVAENDPNIIYVGTGSDGLRSNVIAGKGVYKSIDGGESWKMIGLKETGHIGALEIHPTDHNIVFVAAIGQAFAPNSERGIFRTKNGGKSWEKVLYLSDTTGFADLEFMPSNPNIIYATAWRAERKPWTIISGGEENGIYKSVDGGDTWEKLKNGLPAGIVGKIDLAVSRADSKVLYALVEAPGKKGGLYRSDDQGESFRQVSDYGPLTDRPFYYCNVDVDPQNPEVVYVMATSYHKSVDGGKTWSRLQPPHGDNHDMWINPDNPQLFIQANDGGANITHNGGKTWSTQLNQPTAELYQVEVDDHHPYRLYAGQQDNYTTIAVPSMPPHGHQAGPIGFVENTGGCETGPAVPKPGDPDIVYANCKGRFSVYNRRTGQEQSYDVGAAYMYGHNPKDLKFRFQRVSPIHVSPHDPGIVYHTSQFVHRTTDEGKSWEIISPDLTAFEPDKQVISGAPITRDITGEEFYSTIYAIRESPVTAGLIWVGANDGPVHVTRDGGKNWQKVTPKDLLPNGRVDCVEPSPHDPAKAYIAVLRYQLGDWKPYIYRTNNYGKSWTLLTTGKNGLPEDFPTRVVREDPDREGVLYAGTEYGLFISLDDGQNWRSFQQNLPVTPITDLKVYQKDLVISTMGRSFWILDNLTPLHQQLDQLKDNQVTLFKPRSIYRSRFMRGRNTGHVSYPLAAATIDYYLPDTVTTPIRLDILDSDGKTVRTFVSNLKGKQKEAEIVRDMATNEVSYSANSNLETGKGLHRFQWDMRHTGAWDDRESNRYDRGPMVSPGSYTARLQVSGQTFEQSFELVIDPNVAKNGVSVEDLKKQEAIALKIVDLHSDAKRMAHQAGEDLKKLKGKASKAVEKQRLATLEELIQKLETAEGTYMQPMLIAQINYLYGIVNGADQLPGQDVYQRFEELQTQLQALKTEASEKPD